MKMYQLHQICAVVQCFRLQGFKQMVKKPTHDSGTIIYHVYVSQAVNTIQTVIMIAFYIY